MTYVPYSSNLLIDRCATSKTENLLLSSRRPSPVPAGSDRERDTNLAAAVTEIVRRILTERIGLICFGHN
jgi:hypothetical protein